MVWKEGQELQAGKYIVGDVLGQGGFGITYQALHTTLNQQVVIKTPNEHLKRDPDYDKYVRRFIKEAQLIAQLSQDPHPHIVRVSDLFQEAETHCLVMEFIPGKSLFELVGQQGALPEAEALNYIRQIGDALAFVHQQGLVHRDAHPGNIMLRGKGKAVLIDFGICGELVPTTVSSMHPGHGGFAPIEQMKGDRQPTVDIYCLAATLYYTVTGERPTSSFDRKAFDIELPPPKQLNSNISKRLNQSIVRGMALEAKERPQSMQQWLKLLEAPKVVIPPPVFKLPKAPKVVVPAPVKKTYRQEIVWPSPKKSPALPPRKPDTRQTRTIPWIWLVLLLISYLSIGSFLTEAKVLVVVWAWAVAGAWVMAGAVAEIVTIIFAMIFAMFWFLVVAVAVVGTWAGAVAVVGAVTVAVAGAVIATKLGKSFSKSQTFVILSGTSILGLTLGWLVQHSIEILSNSIGS
ncbi:MAG: serine/threonine protein kinase [Symploca sp. SIO2E9]|nr:serine/threonine protein kinase [Symploca sp. SIO2E9]